MLYRVQNRAPPIISGCYGVFRSCGGVVFPSGVLTVARSCGFDRRSFCPCRIDRPSFFLLTVGQFSVVVFNTTLRGLLVVSSGCLNRLKRSFLPSKPCQPPKIIFNKYFSFPFSGVFYTPLGKRFFGVFLLFYPLNDNYIYYLRKN